MDKRARSLLLIILFFCCCYPGRAADARFDLIGPKIDVRVTRTAADGTTQTLPIAAVPNLQPGDKLWIHPDLPPTQSVKYLLICVFLRGNTNPPPDNWFTRIETWDPKVRSEGAFVTVPSEAQQAVLFMAPETGGDFSTLRSAVRGKPAAFVRASQDLIEAGFEEARIEKYIASIRRVPPSDPAELQKHSDLLARTLALKPNSDCFKRPVDTQFTCLTQTGSQVVLDDGHGQTISEALNGPTSDLISQASYTQAAGGGLYSAYVGAIVDMVKIIGSLHTAQYQYIPAISFPQAESMNLRLNTPPSFHKPMSVLVIALPPVQASVPPPLRSADANEVVCLIKPSVVLPIEGAPLVFSTDFATNLVLHLNTPPGAPAEPDIPLIPDAYFGGLVLQKNLDHRSLLRDPLQPKPAEPNPFAHTDASKPAEPAPPPPKPIPEPVLITGTIQGRWGFDPYTGPSVPLQQLPGSDWAIVPDPSADPSAGANLIAGHTATLLLTSTGSACIHTIVAHPVAVSGAPSPELTIPFKPAPKPDQPNLVELTLPLEHDLTPGDLHLAIQQYDQPKADQVSARTFSEPAHVASIDLHAGDKTIVLKGTRLAEIDRLTLGDLVFSPAPEATDETQTTDPDGDPGTLHFALPSNAPAPPTHIGDNLVAQLSLRDGRSLTIPVTVSAARPVVTLLSKTSTPQPGSTITLTNPDDLALNSLLTFTLKSPTNFPRNGEVEIETTDGTLRTVLTLAPSGGLLLQDPHTVVATLDPLRSFGPSAFGALHMRAVFPIQSRTHGDNAPHPASGTDQAAPIEAEAAPTSDWLPLVTLVRLPIFTQLQCPPDITQTCTITGSNLFLLADISTTPAFDDPQPVPDGYTGTTLTVPHPSAATLFLKLRDDPANIDSAILPVASHVHSASRPPQPASATSTTPPVTAPVTIPATPAATQQSPSPSAPSPPSAQNPT
jgi:hypothetical protein